MKMLQIILCFAFSLIFGSIPNIVKSDTVYDNKDSIHIINYMSNGYDSIPIHFSTTHVVDGVVVGYTLIWDDTLSYLMYDSATTRIYNTKTETIYWRNGTAQHYLIEYSKVVTLNFDDDSRYVIFKADYDEIEYDFYEKRIFCDRVVELYFLNGIKVYSAFTELTCPIQEIPKKDIADSVIVPIG